MSATKSKAKKPAAKTATKKPTAKKDATNTREMSDVQEKLIKLFVRPNGVTLDDVRFANRPAMMCLKPFERRGYKISVVKKEGEPTRCLARKA